MAPSKVYFTNLRTHNSISLPEKLKKLIRKAGIADIDFDKKFAAIKIHFGEPGNLAYLRPNYAKAVADVVKELGRLDVWINNAGRTVHKGMMEIDAAEWHDVIDTDLTSVFFGCKAAANHMKEHGGVILNAGSFQSLFPAAGSGPYGAAKAGVCSLTRSFAAELACWNIRVLTYIPGVIETPMAKVDNWMVATNQQANIPLPRLGKTTDIANALVFLASEKAEYINGVNIEITGGKFCVQNPRYAWE